MNLDLFDISIFPLAYQSAMLELSFNLPIINGL